MNGESGLKNGEKSQKPEESVETREGGRRFVLR